MGDFSGFRVVVYLGLGVTGLVCEWSRVYGSSGVLGFTSSLFVVRRSLAV